MIKITRPNVHIEMTAEEWDLLWAYLVQLDYPDFHNKMSKESSAKLSEMIKVFAVDVP